MNLMMSMIAIDYRWQAYKLTCYLVIPIGSRINEWLIDQISSIIDIIREFYYKIPIR